MSGKMGRNTILLVILGIFSAVFGFIREIQIAKYFGLSLGADMYYLGTYIPELMVTIIGAAASNIYMKQYLSHKNKNQFAGSVILLLSIIVSILFLVMILLFPLIAHILAPGFSKEEISIFIDYGRIMLVAMIGSVYLGVIVATLNINGRFLLAGLNGLVFNLLLIFITYIMVPVMDLYGLAWSYTIAHLARIAFLLPTTTKYFRRGHLKESLILLKELPKIVASNFLTSLQIYFERSLSSIIGNGMVAALNYAGRITTLPNVLIINSIIAVTFPKFINESNENKELFSRSIMMTLKLVVASLLCAELFIILFNEDIVRILLQSGKFSSESTRVVSMLFYFYAPIVLISGVIQVLLKVAFALGKVNITLKSMIISLPVYIISLYVLTHFFGLYGLPSALFIYNLVILISLFYEINKKEKLINNYELKNWTSMVYVVLIIFALWKLLSFHIGGLITLALTAIIYVCIFIGLLSLFDKDFRKYTNILKYKKTRIRLMKNEKHVQ